ncbi:MAG: TlpA disulfide reductase family protein [Bacteroidota bacterium]
MSVLTLFRFLSLSLSGIFLFTVSGWSQEGKVLYEMRHELNPGFEEMASMIPTEMVVYFNPTKVREEQKSAAPGQQFTIIDQINGNYTVCLEIKGKKYALETPQDPSEPVVTPTGNEKVIGGLPCKEVQITKAGEKSLAYITEALPANYNPLAKGQGFVMAFSTTTPQGTFHYEAQQVIFEPIDSSLFGIGPEFQVVTPFELQKILSGQNTEAFEVGKTMNDFTLTTMEGDTIQLSKLKSEFIILNFWFAACKPCVQEIPLLNRLTKRFPEVDITFLAVTFDAKETAQAFIEKHPFDFTICPGATEIIRQLGIVSFPTSVVLSRDLRVAGYEVGSSPKIDAELARIISGALD